MSILLILKLCLFVCISPVFLNINIFSDKKDNLGGRFRRSGFKIHSIFQERRESKKKNGTFLSKSHFVSSVIKILITVNTLNFNKMFI